MLGNESIGETAIAEAPKQKPRGDLHAPTKKINAAAEETGAAHQGEDKPCNS